MDRRVVSHSCRQRNNERIKLSGGNRYKPVMQQINNFNGGNFKNVYSQVKFTTNYPKVWLWIRGLLNQKSRFSKSSKTDYLSRIFCLKKLNFLNNEKLLSYYSHLKSIN